MIPPISMLKIRELQGAMPLDLIGALLRYKKSASLLGALKGLPPSPANTPFGSGPDVKHSQRVWDKHKTIFP